MTLVVELPVTHQDIENIKDLQWHEVCLCDSCSECELFCTMCTEHSTKLEVAYTLFNKQFWGTYTKYTAFYRYGETIKKLYYKPLTVTNLGDLLLNWMTECFTYEVESLSCPNH